MTNCSIWLKRHKSKYPIGLKINDDIIIDNGIYNPKIRTYFIKLKCVCGEERVEVPCNISKCKVCRNIPLNYNDFYMDHVNVPLGKLTIVGYTFKPHSKQKSLQPMYVFTCQCNPAIYYMTGASNFMKRKKLYCHLCKDKDDKLKRSRMIKKDEFKTGPFIIPFNAN